MFGIYIRVSRLGDRTEDEATDTYEGQCREWLRRNGLEVGPVVEDTDVSGSVKVEDRGLETLIRAVEAGELQGIVTPYLDRFGRDTIEGATAYRRIALAGGRLVTVCDGQDSDRPGDKLVFQLRMAIAEDYLDRVRSNFRAKVEEAWQRGVYLSARAPFGYHRRDDVEANCPERDGGQLVADDDALGLVLALFERRAERRPGDNLGTLTRWMNEEAARLGLTVFEKDETGARDRVPVKLTKSGVRHVLSNRVYLGEQDVQTERKGETKTVPGPWRVVLTEAQWQAAQWSPDGFAHRDGSLAKQAAARGLVYCGTCGRRLRIVGYGRKDRRTASYACTGGNDKREPCTARACVSVKVLDPHLSALVAAAKMPGGRGFEYVSAVDNGSAAYFEALEAVEAAQRDLAAVRDDADMLAELGREQWAAMVKTCKARVDVARRELAMHRPPMTSEVVKTDGTLDVPALLTDEVQRYIRRVEVRPGRGLDVSERVSVLFVGEVEGENVVTLPAAAAA